MLSARRLGAEQLIPMGRHPARTDVVAARGAEGIEQVRDLTGGDGTHAVLEAVGTMPAFRQALGVVRPGGVISRVGVPQYDDAPIGMGSLFRHNLRLAGVPAS
ncbi:zinc-binding dehydrogenase [Nonomuraea sp. NPDC004702]